MSDSEVTTEALQWIVSLLNKHDIPFQITGGLAGRVYGSERPLNDIDLDVPESRLPEIIPDVQEFIEFGPQRYKDSDWDLMQLTLNYHGQNIELGGAETTKSFDKETNTWKLVPCDISKAIPIEVLGIKAPVVDPVDYIAYKKSLNRIINGVAIDREDAEAAEQYLEQHQELL